jgi:ribosomal protein S18 acetylase RimI-like enzyme
VTARLGADLAGFAYGYPLLRDTGWWVGSLTPLPTELTRETGDRTLAVGELIVRPDLRGQGIASRLHADLIRGRPERRGVLLVYPDNTVAKVVYESWGWRRVGQIRPSERAPAFDAYLLEPLGGR